MTETPAGDRDPAIDPQLERLLDAPTSPVAAPWNALAEVLMAASAPAGDGPQPGEARALAAFRELVPPVAPVAAAVSRRRRLAVSRPRAWKVAVAGLSGFVAFSGGAVALAASNSLPGAAQSVAHDVLGTLGVHVPGPNSHAGNHPNQRGHSADTHPSATPSAHPSAHPSHPAHPTHPTHPAHPSGQPATPGANGSNGGNQGQHNGVGQGGTPTPHSTNAGHADTHPSPHATPTAHGQSH